MQSDSSLTPRAAAGVLNGRVLWPCCLGVPSPFGSASEWSSSCAQRSAGNQKQTGEIREQRDVLGKMIESDPRPSHDKKNVNLY